MPAARQTALKPNRRHPHRVIIARGEKIRTFTVRPWLIVGAVFVGVLVTVGYLGATGYLAFRDDLLATSIARQASMQQTYEDKIASLRSDIDRLTSRQLLNQEDVQAEVDKLVSRQAALSGREDAIDGLTSSVRAAGITPPPSTPKPASGSPTTTAAASPSPVNAGTVAVPSPEPRPTIKSAFLLPSVIDSAEAKPADPTWKPPLAQMSEVEAALDRLATGQVSYVNTLTASVSDRNERMSTILKSIGAKVPASAPGDIDVGGPFVPLPTATEADAFNASIALASAALTRYAAIRKTMDGLPLTLPVPDAIVTSGFGVRMDPFLDTPAMHTGIDYAARDGQPIGATAPGIVVAASVGYNGGYGNMVDIDHGNGIVTRFGHLSEIDVKVGQVVQKGTIIGKAGETGRATGPHLHYEVRVNDQPVDPTTFIAAGDKLAKLF